MTDIFIKTWPQDYDWLVYCLRSIDKFFTGHRQVVILTESGGKHPALEHAHRMGAKVIQEKRVREKGHKSMGRIGTGYQVQKAKKLEWDLYTDADHVIQIDSDCMFTAPCTPDLWIDADGRMTWWRMSRSRLPKAECDMWGDGLRWQDTKLGPSQWYGMISPGFAFNRIWTAQFRDWVRQHLGGLDMKGLFCSKKIPHITEYLIYPHWAEMQQGCPYDWVRTAELPKPPIKQNWSWGGLSPEIKTELESILN